MEYLRRSERLDIPDLTPNRNTIAVPPSDAVPLITPQGYTPRTADEVGAVQPLSSMARKAGYNPEGNHDRPPETGGTPEVPPGSDIRPLSQVDSGGRHDPSLADLPGRNRQTEAAHEQPEPEGVLSAQPSDSSNSPGTPADTTPPRHMARAFTNPRSQEQPIDTRPQPSPETADQPPAIPELDFTLTRADELFDRLGMQPRTFNSGLYKELLNEVYRKALETSGSAPRDGVQGPNVKLTPWPLALAPSRLSAWRQKTNKELTSEGLYVDSTNSLEVRIRPGEPPEATNHTALHETKHWLDAVLGVKLDLEAVDAERIRQLRSMWIKGAVVSTVAGGALGEGLYQATDSPVYGSLALLGTALTVKGYLDTAGRKMLYKTLPWEEEAEEFAQQSDIVDRYGKIITVPGSDEPFRIKRFI